MQTTLLNKDIFLKRNYPNGYGKPEYYKLTNKQLLKISQEEALANPQNILGYMMYFLSWRFEQQYCAIFIYEDCFWIFYNNNFIKIKEQSIKIKQILPFKTAYINKDDHNPLILEVFTPPYRWLFNDGMFPEEVEPLIDFLIDINQDYDGKLSVVKNLPALLKKDTEILPVDSSNNASFLRLLVISCLFVGVLVWLSSFMN